MSRRKGELSGAALDRDWPHQIALRADFVAGSNHAMIELVKSALSGAPRGHSVQHNDIAYVVYCFDTDYHAATFCSLFRGEPFNPKDRGRGARWMDWNRPPPSKPKANEIEDKLCQLVMHLKAARALADECRLSITAAVRP